MIKLSGFINIIKASPLFKNISDSDIAVMLGCLTSSVKHYESGEYILQSGESVSDICLVLEGTVYLQKGDYWGNRNILSILSPSDIFAEAYACVQNSILQVEAVAAENAMVLFLDYKKVITVCDNACKHHSRLISNLLTAISEKNLLINEKLTHISQRSTREKLLSYLSSESVKQSKAEFEIPFNRQQLADYLSVERSAMSAELGRMRNDGLLLFSKNRIKLL